MSMAILEGVSSLPVNLAGHRRGTMHCRGASFSGKAKRQPQAKQKEGIEETNDERYRQASRQSRNTVRNARDRGRSSRRRQYLAQIDHAAATKRALRRRLAGALGATNA